jgi:hypothetical protein
MVSKIERYPLFAGKSVSLFDIVLVGNGPESFEKERERREGKFFFFTASAAEKRSG